MNKSYTNMKLITIRTGFSTICLLASTIASAGPISSGGGNAIVCRGVDNAIQSAELFDLYEARVRYGLMPVTSSGQMEQDYILGVRNTYHLQGADDLELGKEVRENLDRFFQISRFTKPGESLPLLNDRGIAPAAPAGCAIEQLAIFHDASQAVDIDSDIWEKLNSLSKAALVTHELFYKYERELAEKTSEGTRALVAQIYTSTALKPVSSGIPANAKMCLTGLKNGEFESQSKTSVFYTYSGTGNDARGQQVKGVYIHLSHIMGRPLLTLSTVFLPGVGAIVSEGRIHLYELSDGDFRISKTQTIGGSHRRDWKLELTQFTNSQGEILLKMGLVQSGVLLEESVVTKCY